MEASKPSPVRPDVRRVRFIAMLLAATVLPTGLMAQYQWVTNGGAITITKYTGPNGPVTIPETITGLPVTTIGNGAFRGRAVSSIAIPNTVAAIEENAFSYNIMLTNVSLPKDLNYLGSHAFFGCAALPSIDIPPRGCVGGGLDIHQLQQPF